MIRTCLNYVLAALLLLGPVAPMTIAVPRAGQRPSAEEVKIKVAKLGTGAKAKATVWLADGTKVKGYVSQMADNDFVMRDRKTDAPTTIRYGDVVKFDRNRGHSTAKWMGIGIGVGVGGFLIILFASLAHLD